MKDRLMGAFFVVVYTLLMWILPLPFYHLLVYLLGVFAINEVLSISGFGRFQTAVLLIFSLLFLVFVKIPEIVKLLSGIYSDLALSFFTGSFISYLLMISPAILTLSLFVYVLIVDGSVSKDFFVVLSFLIYTVFGIFSLAALSKPVFLLLISVVWSTDTFAYLTGKYFGKRRLAPAVSPKKTVEGSFGGSILGTAVSYIVALKLAVLPSGVFTALFLLVLTVVAQLGDLLESALKRNFNVKDSGNVIPGHGGILDRIDSALAVAPVLFVVGGGR